MYEAIRPIGQSGPLTPHQLRSRKLSARWFFSVHAAPCAPLNGSEDLDGLEDIDVLLTLSRGLCDELCSLALLCTFPAVPLLVFVNCKSSTKLNSETRITDHNHAHIEPNLGTQLISPRMTYQPPSRLLSVPTEIRLQIYKYLLEDGKREWICIRNKATPIEWPNSSAHKTTQTKYHVVENTSMCQQRFYETTYCQIEGERSHFKFHPSIMAVCRLLHREAAEVLYGNHGFDFNYDLEAVVPFLTDRTEYSRALIRRISVCKGGPFAIRALLSGGGSSTTWAHMCQFLARSNPPLRRLQVVVDAGQPSEPWEGPQRLSVSDIRLLKGINIGVLDWIQDLAEIKGLEELQIVPSRTYMPPPQTTSTIVYAALSASLKEGVGEYLKAEMSMAHGGTVVVEDSEFVKTIWDRLQS